jgi:dTDP-6-deoxy-L-talose 4-dehydrogenase (NAD+)
MRRRILVTGANGFIGKHVTRALTSSACDLILVVRHANADQARRENPAAQVVGSDDLFSESALWWSDKCQDVDAVAHLAWFAEPGDYLDSEKNIDCVIGSLNLAKGAVLSKVKRFIGIGTCVEYDLSPGTLTVGTELKPTTIYASSKVALYNVLSNWLREGSTEFAWCRLFNLYGEGEDPRRLVPYLRSKLQNGEEALLSEGTQVRDFMDVADAGRLIAQVILSDHQGAVNVCSGEPVTIREIAERIADEYGRRDLLKFGAIPDNLGEHPRIVGVPNFP